MWIGYQKDIIEILIYPLYYQRFKRGIIDSDVAEYLCFSIERIEKKGNWSDNFKIL